jgi:isopentenyl diphosphate isomerase/L-lactate dehydrogenase-like FMN-dependent dehydrogenase
MKKLPDPIRTRRGFLRFLATSPLFAALPIADAYAAFLQQTPAVVPEFIISDPMEAIDVLEFEAAARKALPPAHWGYMTTGVDDDATLRANREGFTHYQLRARRLVDVSKIDMSVELFGSKWETPVLLSPSGTLFHPQGPLPVARAAQKQKHLFIVGGVQERTHNIEEVIKNYGAPCWYQLYANQDTAVTLQTVKRIESAGVPVLVWTVDILGGRNLETVQRFARVDTRQCMSCHENDPRQRPGNAGRNVLTYDTLKRIKDSTKMKVVVKGIESAEDAELCVQNGADGIIVSNHGGRATDTGRGTIECLPEVVGAVRNRVPVIVDGGFRRGSDVFKALALGAKAVGIGRPYMWGLAAFGQPGVEAVLGILRREVNLVMAQCGKRSIAEINSASIIKKNA